MQQEDIEIQLWEYIDGSCDEAEQKRISLLIANDTIWAETYTQLSTANIEFQSNLTTATPSVNFTNNVIQQLPAKEASRSRTILNLSVKTTGYFFIASVLAATVYAIFNTDWEFEKSNIPNLNLNIAKPEIQLSNSALFAVAFIATILLLIMADSLFRKKMQRQL